MPLIFLTNKNISSLFNILDKIIINNGIRLYLAKDKYMSSDMFEKTYSNAADFKHSISNLNNGKNKLSSLLSNRLKIT